MWVRTNLLKSILSMTRKQTGISVPSLQEGDPYLIENRRIGYNTNERPLRFATSSLRQPVSPGWKDVN